MMWNASSRGPSTSLSSLRSLRLLPGLSYLRHNESMRIDDQQLPDPMNPSHNSWPVLVDGLSSSCGSSSHKLWACSGGQHISPQSVLQRAGESALHRLQAGAQAEQPWADALLLEPRRPRRRHEVGPDGR